MCKSPEPCIYCGAPASSREHWLPRSLGRFRGYSPLLNRLCDGCNRHLGRELDEEFARTGEIGFKRELYGVAGRHGASTSSTMFRAESADPPTTIIVRRDDHDHEFLAQPMPTPNGEIVMRHLRQVVVRTREGERRQVPFPRRWSSTELSHALQHRQLEGAELVALYLDDDDDPLSEELRRLLTDVFGKFGADAYVGTGSDGKVCPTSVSAGISRRYIRAIAKAGFHYFLWANALFRGDEPCFAGARAFIHAGEGTWEDFVALNVEQFLPLSGDGVERRPQVPLHALLATISDQEVVTRLQFFLGPHDSPPSPPLRVRLATRPPLRFAATKWISCHWAAYVPTEGHDGELFPIDAWERRIVSPREGART